MNELHKNVNGIEMPLSDDDLAQIAIDEVAAPEAQWAEIRAERNAKLTACDWTQLPDAPADTAAWATYRQELRDITTQDDPFNITWPSEPEFE